MEAATCESPLNHALIQIYRDGTDFISEHADKTLDIQRYTKIAGVSFGASRVLVLRTKDKTRRQLITLPNNSIFILGWETNRLWRHAIKQDKRMPTLKRADETFENGQRISLTFRNIATFRRLSDSRLFGQGALYKTLQYLEVNDKEEPDERKESLLLLEAFHEENASTDFSWGKWYGAGFGVKDFRIINLEQDE